MRLLRIVPDDTNFDFMRFRRISFPISAVLSIVALVAFLTLGLNFGIDFKGGTLLEVRYPNNTLNMADVRSKLREPEPRRGADPGDRRRRRGADPRRPAAGYGKL